MENFNKRVFGAVILKSINSNFNADFTHHPRTLSDGTVYSTDKALKYAIKNYLSKNYTDDKIFYIKRLNEKLNPFSLDETYKYLFGEYKKVKDGKKEIVDKKSILADLLSCLDIKFFGATFAGETNISVHGPLQINHGVNRFPENEIYTEDILSPFRNPGETGSEEKAMSTIGNQTNLKEGHYVFHYSLNPANIKEFCNMVNENSEHNAGIFEDDIIKIKEALNNSVTILDSSRKIGTENEATIWIQLKEGSKKIIPSLTEMIKVERTADKIKIDCTEVEKVVSALEDEIEKVEIYFNPFNTEIIGLTGKKLVEAYNLVNSKELQYEH